jgi:COX assembly protein 1
MMQYATQEEQDAARREWFEGFEERRREKEVKEERRKGEEVFWREWWDKSKGTAEMAEKGEERGR